MPNPTEDVSSSCPRLERGVASLEDPLSRIRRHPRPRRVTDHTESAQPHGRELDCAIPDTKPEERIGIPTPPPSDPESDSGDSSWTLRERELRVPAREKQEEKIEEEDMVHLHSADTIAQSPVVGYDTNAGLVQSMSTASISSLPRYLHYYESERNWVGLCAKMQSILAALVLTSCKEQQRKTDDVVLTSWQQVCWNTKVRSAEV
jgi:hypothetical protein